jgi:glycine cleavage system H protein
VQICKWKTIKQFNNKTIQQFNMSYPQQLKYTKDHEWISLEGDIATIGITEFAQGELGDIVYVDINTTGKALAAEEVFGTVEAVKTVSDLFLPLAGTITEVNPALEANPELVNSDPYGAGWMVKVKVDNPADFEALMGTEAYEKLVG